MKQEKLERIRDINDEVAELHPLLNVLLGRLPTVVSVEYTHGQNEMGADFVFVRNDDAIMEQTYVGLIAKAGQIKQNHEDLKRQIDECSLERKIEGGKKSIYLSEIWVVTTKGISHNAQLKIHESYKTRSIKFIDGPKLSALIDKYYPEYWTDVTVVVGEYLRDMLVKAGELETRSDLLDLDSDLFIKRKLLKIDPPQDRSIRRTKGKKIIREQPEIVLKRDSLIFIEGHMGAGKSKLIGSLAKHFSDPAVVNHREEFPFLITAVDLYREYSGDIDKFISDTIKKYNLPEGKKKLVFIDALDELKLSIDDRISFVSNIHSKSHNSDDIRVVVTSREIDEPSLNTLAHKLFDRYELEPLTMREIFSVVEEVCKGLDIVEKIRKDVSRSHLFREMPKTPIAAIILAKLIREDQNEIPSTMTDLYQKYTELVLGRWDVRKGLVSIKDYEILTHIVMKISSFMMDNGLEDIPEGDVFSLVEEYLSARNLNYRTESVGNMLKSRRNLLHYDTTKHTFSFRHRSFLEFYYALWMKQNNSAHVSEKMYDEYWSTSFFFWVGLHKDASEIIKAIDSLALTDDDLKFQKVFNHGNFLLAAYLTPYKDICDSVALALNHAAELYQDITFGKSDSILGCMSEIQLLCMFTQALVDSFSYEFFARALDEYVRNVAISCDSEELGLLRLFLGNAILVSIDPKRNFDAMLSDYGKGIPLQLQIGIVAHSVDREATTAQVKKMDKNIKKKIRNNPAFKKQLSRYMIDPISEEANKKILALISR